ncbi:unnamed protein product [Macrosiphum euphorbiae]|uniref:Peptidase S1 domain-containing protein n=1 Tax=Macrosiphum euphorbiae TaxID=13131 RepID=A0AAV0VYM6_9HEMI|nr:unnamed protein product [Macrosiphum euphorbiae]
MCCKQNIPFFVPTGPVNGGESTKSRFWALGVSFDTTVLPKHIFDTHWCIVLETPVCLITEFLEISFINYILDTIHIIEFFRVTVRLGDLNLDPNVTDGSEPIDIPISQIMVHEQYNEKQSYINDIALLKLEKSVIFNELIQPICLPVLSHHRSNKLLDSAPFVAGWGSESLKGPLSSVLMEIQVPVIDNAECKRAYYYSKKIIIDDRIICAGSGEKDACHGDSGSPLMWPSGSQYYLVGVVSAGFNCGVPEYPGVYTRVSYFVDWIVDKMNNS